MLRPRPSLKLKEVGAATAARRGPRHSLGFGPGLLICTGLLSGMGTLTACDSAPPDAARPAWQATPPEAPPSLAKAPSSPLPTQAEWDNTRPSKVTRASVLGCEGRVVREWLRLECVPRENLPPFAPQRIDILRGRAKSERFAGEILEARGGPVRVIVPMTEGTDFEAQLVWPEQRHAFSVHWPLGSPISERIVDIGPDLGKPP